MVDKGIHCASPFLADKNLSNHDVAPAKSWDGWFYITVLRWFGLAKLRA
jgi:hypothetical protein